MISNREGHYIMIKESIQEDITITNIDAPNIGACNANVNTCKGGN